MLNNHKIGEIHVFKRLYLFSLYTTAASASEWEGLVVWKPRWIRTTLGGEMVFVAFVAVNQWLCFEGCTIVIIWTWYRHLSCCREERREKDEENEVKQEL